MIRLTEAEIETLDAEYSQTYQLYNVISTVVEDYEGSKGGLRAVEVWREVLELEKRLPKAPRPDKFIASERTRLMKDCKRFWIRGGNKPCPETQTDRKPEDVERSVVCVLLAFGMRLASYPEGMENPYEPIMERIRKMALQCSDLKMVAAITNEYYDAEDEEEGMGNFVLEEDVLKPHVKPRLTRELQQIHDKMSPVFHYYSTALACEGVVHTDVSEAQFYGIWDDLLMNESILRKLEDTSSNIVNSLKDDDVKDDDEYAIVLTDQFNLKLVLNIIGVMMEEHNGKKLITSNISTTRKLFFEDAKDKYFNPRFFKQFGTADSAFPSETMYNMVLKIIDDHLK